MYNNITPPLNVLTPFHSENNLVENKKKEIKFKFKDKEKKMKDSVYIIDYKYYDKYNTILDNYKLDELKYILKNNFLKYSGTKPILIERIKKFFIETKNAIIIQSKFRSWIVKLSIIFVIEYSNNCSDLNSI